MWARASTTSTSVRCGSWRWGSSAPGAPSGASRGTSASAAGGWLDDCSVTAAHTYEVCGAITRSVRGEDFLRRRTRYVASKRRPPFVVFCIVFVDVCIRSTPHPGGTSRRSSSHRRVWCFLSSQSVDHEMFDPSFTPTTRSVEEDSRFVSWTFARFRRGKLSLRRRIKALLYFFLLYPIQSPSVAWCWPPPPRVFFDSTAEGSTS